MTLPSPIPPATRPARRIPAAPRLWPALLLTAATVASAQPILIRLNTVGFPPDAGKKATIAAPCTRFTVMRTGDNAPVFSGKTIGPLLNSDTGETLYTADFSAFKQPGEYQLDVPEVGRSAPFRIGRDVYQEPFRAVTRAFYLWRCGTAVSGSWRGKTFEHGPCHTNDAWLDFVGGGHERRDGTGGWHDAGDYNKYVVNAGVTMGALFRAWEDFGRQIGKVRLDLPEAGGAMPEFLAELKWEMEWLLKMQAPDGSVYHKLSTQKFGGFIPPEAESAERYFTPWGSEATANFVGMSAQAARVFRPYDPRFAERCRQAALKSYAFLKAHPGYQKADQSGFSTGAYEVNQPDHRLSAMPNNRLWAAAELWETTGSGDVLRDLESGIEAIHGRVSADFDWDEVKELGLLTYLFSKRQGRNPALVRLVRSNLLQTADGIVQARDAHGYGRPLGAQYFWGCNGAVARQTLLLMAADRAMQPPPRTASDRGAERQLRLSGPAAKGGSVYRAACADALSHLLGRNPYGRSFVTGIGFQPPQHPHDRRCGEAGEPWPGYLVGGPHPKATDWRDVQADFRTNEIAINWNAALVYALAAWLE